MPVPGQSRKKAGWQLYLALLAVESIGVGIILANGVPIYGRLVRAFSEHRPAEGTIWWAVAAVVIAQTSYWVRVRLAPQMPPFKQVVLGHLAGFVGRLVFVLATSSFAVFFFVRFEQMELPPRRLLLLLCLMFSLYCWALELDRLARSLQDEP